MQDTTRRPRLAIALIAGLCTAAAIGAPCYVQIAIGKTCSLVNCDTSAACLGSIEDGVDDMAYTTSGGNQTGRLRKVAIEFLCYKSWFKVDPATGFCTVFAECNLTYDGNLVSGGICTGGPPV